MDYNDYNWTMKDKGLEILVFFEIFCAAVIVGALMIGKIIDFLER